MARQGARNAQRPHRSGDGDGPTSTSGASIACASRAICAPTRCSVPVAPAHPRASHLVGFLPVRDLVRPVECSAEDPLLGREGAPAQVDATGARHVTSIELVDVHWRRSDVAIGRDRELVVHGARDMDLGVCGLERPQRSDRSLRAQQLGVGGPASPRQTVVDHPPFVVGVRDELIETAQVADRSTVARVPSSNPGRSGSGTGTHRSSSASTESKSSNAAANAKKRCRSRSPSRDHRSYSPSSAASIGAAAS